ncbi:hypothetical protein V5799_026104 [Amblyomma americanum]|uniref:Uncharacterized protein n=1 Tax=Amblyomma americanum TaxID=6943 RepID=A0AAQ4DJI9_AMBAM
MILKKGLEYESYPAKPQPNIVIIRRAKTHCLRLAYNEGHRMSSWTGFRQKTDIRVEGPWRWLWSRTTTKKKDSVADWSASSSSSNSAACTWELSEGGDAFHRKSVLLSAGSEGHTTMDAAENGVRIQGRRRRRVVLLLTSSRLYALASLVFFAALVAVGLVAYFMRLVAGVSAALNASTGGGARAAATARHVLKTLAARQSTSST